MSFRFTTAIRGTTAYVEMIGHLDETAVLPEVTDLNAAAVTIDLAGVNLINSLGCRRWLNWIGEVAARVQSIELSRCSFAFVQQLNVLGGFSPRRALVTSFFVPYACAWCGHQARVLHKIEPSFDVNLVPEALPCAACGKTMTIEVMRQTYFKFLAGTAA